MEALVLIDKKLQSRRKKEMLKEEIQQLLKERKYKIQKRLVML